MTAATAPTPARTAPRWIAARAGAALHGASIATLMVADGIVAIRAWRLLDCRVAAVPYPFELDFGKGPVLAATRALMAGTPLYVPADGASTLIANYPPVYYAASAVLAARDATR